MCVLHAHLVSFTLSGLLETTDEYGFWLARHRARSTETYGSGWPAI